MKERKVSVVMPCHGETPFLREAVESVLNQTIESLQLILVLDRPSKTTANMAKEYAEEEPRIDILESNRPGISSALNYGISQSTGDFIARIDSDDVMFPTRLEIQLKYLESNPSIGCIGSQILVIDAKGTPIRESHYPTNPKKIKKVMIYRNVVAHPSVMFRKEIILGLGGYDEKFNGSEDYDLWLRMIGRNQEIANINRCLTKYRVHSEQVTNKNRAKQTGLDSVVRQRMLQNKKNELAAQGKNGSSIETLLLKRRISTANKISSTSRHGFSKKILIVLLCLIRNPLDVTSFIVNVIIPEKKRLVQ